MLIYSIEISLKNHNFFIIKAACKHLQAASHNFIAADFSATQHQPLTTPISLLPPHSQW